jgi:hypothetical protein
MRGMSDCMSEETTGRANRSYEVHVLRPNSLRLIIDPRFEFIQPPPHRTIASLLGTKLYSAEYLHVAAPDSPQDVYKLLDELETYWYDSEGNPVPDAWRPQIVFEPTPPSCHTGQKEWLERVAGRVHVLS